MAVAKQFQQLVKITNGTTAETDVKLSDPLAMQHIDLTSGANSLNQISLAQSMCQPVAVTPNSTPSGGTYTATCSNYPDFSLTYTDKNGNSHYLVGMKVRVIFTKGIAYGSVSGGTYPTLNINSSGAIPLLAQGKTMAAGAAVDGQSLELTLIPYGNGVAWDADSNVRESTSDYTIYTDGKKYAKDNWLKVIQKNTWTYFHADVDTASNNIFVLKLLISGNTSTAENTHSAEILLRLNFTPYQGTNYRGVKAEVIKAIYQNNDITSTYMQTFGVAFDWDVNGIKIYANYRITIDVYSEFGISYKL